MTSPSTFEPVNMVERQLVAAAHGDAAAQKAFERFILDETLYVATPEAPAEHGETTLQAHSSLRLLNVPLNDGRQAAAVFTSPQRIYEAFGEVGYVALQGRALFEVICTGPAALNPGQPYGVVWEPASLSWMIGLPVERVVEKATTLMLGSPSEPPLDLITRLKAALARVAGVEGAWLALAVWPDDQRQSWYVDVRFAGDDREPVQRAFSAALDGADLAGRPVDMVINPVGSDPGTGIALIEPDASPATKKGWLGKLFG